MPVNQSTSFAHFLFCHFRSAPIDFQTTSEAFRSLYLTLSCVMYVFVDVCLLSCVAPVPKVYDVVNYFVCCAWCPVSLLSAACCVCLSRSPPSSPAPLMKDDSLVPSASASANTVRSPRAACAHRAKETKQ